MMNRKIMILTIFFVTLLAISAVSANENMEKTNESSSVDEIQLVEQSDNDILDFSQTDALENTKTVEGDSFASIQNAVDSAQAGDTIYLGGKTYKGNGQTIMINKSITLIGGVSNNDNVYSTLDAQKLSRIMIVNANDVTIRGITFINANSTGFDSYWGNGAGIYVKGHVSVVNCTFNNNSARLNGGGIYLDYNSEVSAINCIFNNNHADYGGAMFDGIVRDCVFNNNVANEGGAMSLGNAVNCIFNNNVAEGNGGAVASTDVENCIFNNNFANDTGGAIFEGNAVNCVFNNNSACNGGGAIFDGEADSCIFKTNSDSVDPTNYLDPTLTVFDYNSTYNSGDRLNFNLTSHWGVVITNRDITVNIYKNNIYVGTYHCLSGEGLPINLEPGSYVAFCYPTDFEIDSVNATLTIRLSTKITTSSGVVTYNSNKYLIVTLSDDQGRPIAGVDISVELNGLKTFTTDKNGQIKVPTKGLNPKTYVAKLTFDGNSEYFKSAIEVKVTVKKATVKLTAKPKRFKAKKAKKYTVTLKDNNGKAMKNIKLTLKVKGKKYKAKTKDNGKATFKITKLTKKGKFKATVTFKGNKCYNKVVKKVKITVNGS